MKLSKRLKAIADLVDKYKKGTVLADIGTDHAYLPVYLVLNNIVELAYGCDIAQGPLQSSKETVQIYHLHNRVIPLLGSGMDPIIDKDVDMVTISGMGGILITEILESHLDNYLFILQANTDIDILRKYLFDHSMKIIDEDIVEDAHHIYEIIVCIHTDNEITYNEYDLIFGPCLRKNKTRVFYDKWKHQLDIQKRILKTLPSHHQRVKEVNHMINMIEIELEGEEDVG